MRYRSIRLFCERSKSMLSMSIKMIWNSIVVSYLISDEQFSGWWTAWIQTPITNSVERRLCCSICFPNWWIGSTSEAMKLTLEWPAFRSIVHLCDFPIWDLVNHTQRSNKKRQFRLCFALMLTQYWFSVHSSTFSTPAWWRKLLGNSHIFRRSSFLCLR
jgi:hypothetical protein